MKKFFALFLATLYFVFANAGLALASNLYFVKNSSKENIKNSIVTALQNKNYTVTKQDPYYAISNKNNGDYILIILQKSSNNYFYYIDSSNNDTAVNKLILKALRNMDVEYEESFNTQYLSMFSSQAQKILTNTVGQYSFQNGYDDDDEYGYIDFQESIINSAIYQQPQSGSNIYQPNAKTVTAPVQHVQQLQTQNNNALRGSVIQVAKGAKFKTYLQTPIDTSTASVGDEVRAVLSENWVYGGKVIAPQGRMLTGNLSKARHATYGSRNGRVVFSFNTLTTPEGQTYSIATEEVDFTVTNDGKVAAAVTNILVGAALGALTGLLIGACSKDSSTWATTAVSAGVGAAGGAVKIAAEKGIDAEIPIYTEMEVSLTKPFSIVTNY